MFLKLVKTFLIIFALCMYGSWAIGQENTKADQPFTTVTIIEDPKVKSQAAPQKKPKPLARRPHMDTVYAWKTELEPAQNRKVYNAIGKTPLAAQNIINDLSNQVTLAGPNTQRCKSVSSSCASYMAVDERVTEFKLYFRPEHLDNPFVILHEVGHAVDYAGLSKKSSGKFYRAFKHSSAWPKGGFYDDDGYPVPMVEVFADQFAIWVTGKNVAETGYHTHRLLTDAQFERLLLSEYDPTILPIET